MFSKEKEVEPDSVRKMDRFNDLVKSDKARTAFYLIYGAYMSLFPTFFLLVSHSFATLSLGFCGVWFIASAALLIYCYTEPTRKYG